MYIYIIKLYKASYSVIMDSECVFGQGPGYSAMTSNELDGAHPVTIKQPRGDIQKSFKLCTTPSPVRPCHKEQGPPKDRDPPMLYAIWVFCGFAICHSTFFSIDMIIITPAIQKCNGDICYKNI